MRVLFCLSAKMVGKRTPVSEYRKQSRGGKGIYTIKVTERNGGVVGICRVDDNDHIMIMTSQGSLFACSC